MKWHKYPDEQAEFGKTILALLKANKEEPLTSPVILKIMPPREPNREPEIKVSYAGFSFSEQEYIDHDEILYWSYIEMPEGIEDAGF